MSANGHQIFAGKLVDTSHGTLNEVTMAEHWSTGAQVVVYATDYVEFTYAGSPLTFIALFSIPPELATLLCTLSLFDVLAVTNTKQRQLHESHRCADAT